MDLEVLTGFDGSCPRFSRGVKRGPKGRFTLYPSLRKRKGISEEAPGAGSRLSTRIRNDGTGAARTELVVDWETDQRTLHHDLGYIRHEGQHEWTMIPGVREGRLVTYRLSLPPGVTELGLYPECNYAACRQFVESLQARRVQVEVIGQSREARPIWQIGLPSKNKKAKCFFIQARDHAYETAGSYCVEGIVDFLLSGDELAGYLRSKFSVVIVPMTNPDGVHNGMSRLTWERGADLNRVHTEADAAHDTLKAAIDQAKPFVHMNVHNWTDKFVDGLLCNEENIAERILSHLPDDRAHYKRWTVETLWDYLRRAKLASVPVASQSWKDYAREHFGSIGVNFELPWPMRNTADMRERGKLAFSALALALVEELRL